MKKNSSNNKPKSQKRSNKPARQSSASAVRTAPVAKTQVSRNPAPKIDRSFPNGDVIVEHTEFLADINGSVAFAVNSYPVNPGLFASFPWLYQMAILYESYQFLSLEFEFRTESATTATGSVMAAVDYDPSDPAPTTKVQMATYRGYKRCAPWDNMKQTSIREDLTKRKSYFVRNGALPAGQDLQLYDTGNFYLATTKQADSSVVGELYVHYRVRLMTPQLSNPGIGSALSGRYSFATTPGYATIPGSKAPLVLDLTQTGGNFLLTATAPYNCLVVYVGRGDGPYTFTTSASTATIELPQFASSSGMSTLSVWSAQVSFLPGQTLSIVPSVIQTSAGVQVGQFDTVNL